MEEGPHCRRDRDQANKGLVKFVLLLALSDIDDTLNCNSIKLDIGPKPIG